MIQGIILTACMCCLFVAVIMAVYRNLQETAEYIADAKYRELYENANIDWMIDVKIIDERKRK